MKVESSAIIGDYEIKKLESGTINVLKKEYVGEGKNLEHLRKIAKKIGVDILNSKGNKKNTRQLGNDIIKKINAPS